MDRFTSVESKFLIVDKNPGWSASAYNFSFGIIVLEFGDGLYVVRGNTDGKVYILKND